MRVVRSGVYYSYDVRLRAGRHLPGRFGPDVPTSPRRVLQPPELPQLRIVRDNRRLHDVVRLGVLDGRMCGEKRHQRGGVERAGVEPVDTTAANLDVLVSIH